MSGVCFVCPLCLADASAKWRGGMDGDFTVECCGKVLAFGYDGRDLRRSYISHIKRLTPGTSGDAQ